MNELTLKNILEEMCLEEANEFLNMENVPNHHFSLRHRKVIKKILSVNHPKRDSLRSLSPSKRIVIVSVLIFLALFTITAATVAIKGFIQKEHRDNTQLFAANIEGSPSKIEHRYYLSEIPDGFEVYDEDISITYVYVRYINLNNDSITFYQNVKENYNQHFDNERTSFEEVDINGNYGLYLDLGKEKSKRGDLVWDDGDYIFEINGDLPKNELINLAKSAKFLKT